MMSGGFPCICNFKQNKQTRGRGGGLRGGYKNHGNAAESSGGRRAHLRLRQRRHLPLAENYRWVPELRRGVGRGCGVGKGLRSLHAHPPQSPAQLAAPTARPSPAPAGRGALRHRQASWGSGSGNPPRSGLRVAEGKKRGSRTHVPPGLVLFAAQR